MVDVATDEETTMRYETDDRGWRDRVASDEKDLRGGTRRTRKAGAAEALAFAELVIECAVRPVLAMAATLPALLHFEIREHAERHASRSRR